MNILYLYSNFKWTGPAELALQQLVGLNDQPGVTATLAVAGHFPAGDHNRVAKRARVLGLPLRDGLQLRRHFHLASFRADAKQVAQWLDAGDYDVLHCHLPGDHLLGARAVALARRRVPLVRSYWEGKPPRGPRAWYAFRETDLLLPAFPGQAGSAEKRRNTTVQPPVLGAVPDLPPRVELTARLRREFTLPDDAFVIGLTAHIQNWRRWDVVWRTMARLVGTCPRAHLCVLGRADTDEIFERVCRRPLAELGMTGHVHFLGYRRDQPYWDAVGGFQAFLFLVPGADATCRGLREAMALGLPVVSSDLGFLPRIVDHERTGLVAPAQPEDLAQALVRLLGDAALRARLGAAAAAHADKQWNHRACAEALVALYGRVLGG